MSEMEKKKQKVQRIKLRIYNKDQKIQKKIFYKEKNLVNEIQ